MSVYQLKYQNTSFFPPVLCCETGKLQIKTLEDSSSYEDVLWFNNFIILKALAQLFGDIFSSN